MIFARKKNTRNILIPLRKFRHQYNIIYITQDILRCYQLMRGESPEFRIFTLDKNIICCRFPSSKFSNTTIISFYYYIIYKHYIQQTTLTRLKKKKKGSDDKQIQLK